jgi:hypothetical protein
MDRADWLLSMITTFLDAPMPETQRLAMADMADN